MPANEDHVHRAQAEAAHAAATPEIERLGEVAQALEVARQSLSSLSTDAQGPLADVDRTIAQARADLTELATALAGHLAELQRAASARGHRY